MIAVPPRLLVAGLLLGALVAPAHADDPAVDDVRIGCDAGAGVLRIEKQGAGKLPRDRWTRSLSDMVGLKPLPRDDAAAYPTNDLRRTCRIVDARYVVRVRAVVFGSHVMGRCGAADPGAAVSVWRDHVKLLDDFLMVDNCGDTGTSGLQVATLEFAERTHALRLGATLEDAGAGTTPFALAYDLAATPGLTLEKVWSARPAATRVDRAPTSP